MTREEAIKVLYGIRNLNYREWWDEECDEAIDMAIDALRTGTWRWVDFWTKDRTRTKHGIQCSECGECYEWDDPYVFPSYCSECGAKMEGIEEE